MIQKIEIENFRSILKESVDLAPLTILYGSTSSGKSSLFYSMMLLRNFVLDPNRAADAFFHMGFMDLGGFDACVYKHRQETEIKIKCSYSFKDSKGSYSISLGKKKCNIIHSFEYGELQMEVPIPYPLNKTEQNVVSDPFTNELYSVNWNGIGATVAPLTVNAENEDTARKISEKVNYFGEFMKKVDIAPPTRGFFKPNYTPSKLSTTPTTEDEVASIIINDPYMAGNISVYAEKIFNRDFRTQTLPGTSTVSFQVTDKAEGRPVPSLLVNDGFGVNQVIYLLAKMNRTDINTLFIEEPEVHLHPTAVRNFARTLCDFIKHEEKQIIVTTHSELFLTSILTVIAEGMFDKDLLRCYHVKKENQATKYEEQVVNERGQLKGGLSSFVESEYADVMSFLKINENA